MKDHYEDFIGFCVAVAFFIVIKSCNNYKTKNEAVAKANSTRIADSIAKVKAKAASKTIRFDTCSTHTILSTFPTGGQVAQGAPVTHAEQEESVAPEDQEESAAQEEQEESTEEVESTDDRESTEEHRVEYWDYNSDTRATYTLNVTMKGGEVERIYFGYDEYIDRKDFVSSVNNGDGSVTIKTHKDERFTIYPNK